MLKLATEQTPAQVHVNRWIDETQIFGGELGAEQTLSECPNLQNPRAWRHVRETLMQLPPFQGQTGDTACLLPSSRQHRVQQGWGLHLHSSVCASDSAPSKLKLSQEPTWALPSRPSPLPLAGYCAGKTEGLAKKGFRRFGNPGPLGLQLPRGLATGAMFSPRQAKRPLEGGRRFLRHRRARPPSRNDNVPFWARAVSHNAARSPGRGAREAGAAMAAVFDLDLETEEGSEGEGEPEFSPAVSEPLAKLDPGAIPITLAMRSPRLRRPRVGSALAVPGLSQIPTPIKL